MEKRKKRVAFLKGLPLALIFTALTVFNVALYWSNRLDQRQQEAAQANILLQSWVRDYAKTHRTLPRSIEATFPSWAGELWPVNPYSKQPVRHVLRTDKDYIGNFTYFQFVKGNGYGDVIVSYVPRNPLSLDNRFETGLEFLSAYTDSHYSLVADGLSPDDVFKRLEVEGWKGLKEPPVGTTSLAKAAE